MNKNNRADLWKRLHAFGYDYLLMIGYLIGVTGVSVSLIFLFDQPAEVNNPILADSLVFLTIILPIMSYFAWRESSSKQAGWGKQKVGLQLVNKEGERVLFRQAFGRNFFKFLPWQIAHTCIFHIEGVPLNPQEPPLWVNIGFGLVWLLVLFYLLTIGIAKRAPYDWLAGVYVIDNLNS